MFLLHRLSDGTDEWLCETSELSPSHTASQGSAGMQARAAKREGEGMEGGRELGCLTGSLLCLRGVCDYGTRSSTALARRLSMTRVGSVVTCSVVESSRRVGVHNSLLTSHCAVPHCTAPHHTTALRLSACQPRLTQGPPKPPERAETAH
jgi:hypothetical protein